MRGIFWLLTLMIVMRAAAIEASPKGACLVCHKLRTPELYQAWLSSAHARHNVTCLDCHEAAPDEADAFAHGGANISVLVTPKDCVGCHEVEAGQYTGSAHAASAVDPATPGSWGDPATCRDCHGAPTLADPVTRNRLRSGAWPDRGTGRGNPDGSRGACSACHADHAFSLSTARLDKTCRSCHSKGHQPTHAASAVPAGIPELSEQESRTCAACHLGAGTRSVTHNPARARKR